MKARLLITGAFMASVGSACLYTGDIEPYASRNHDPHIDNYLPHDGTVTLGSEATRFYVVYSDQDGDPLDIAWYLVVGTQTKILAEGYAVYVSAQDLGELGTGTLYVTVTDPAGASAFVVWALEAESTMEGG